MLSRLCIRSTALNSRRLLATSAQLSKEGVRSAQGQVDDWITTNRKISRPMSPHLGIYQWTIPMTFSAVNRIFAFALVGAFMLLPFLDILGSGCAAADIAAFGTSMRETTVGTTVVMGLKAAIVFPFAFHTFLGFRHWGWDVFAVGIRNMATLYTTGYIALGLAAVVTAGALLYHK